MLPRPLSVPGGSMRATLVVLLLLASATVPVSAPAGETPVREARYLRTPQAEPDAGTRHRRSSMSPAASLAAQSIRVGPPVLSGLPAPTLSYHRFPARDRQGDPN